ncbi:MAG: response regulator transcription factor [Croceitalea sp.]|nr:response regulator transcription factor [Croceitalea sp.]MBT8239016.1 response regulator transcription factor [Croceitalea sp.]NNC34439.1 response regulator transcription factor [Croceitalea sp.]NNL10126.1 response regulator transcription factor [Croceitalea sp.]
MNHTIKIVVADDHPLLLNGLRNELLEQNFNVLEGATNGAKALELIFSEKPDIAILDINMPILSGFEVIKKCREKGVATKFIVFTSFKEKSYILKAKQLQISAYLLKDEPFIEVKNAIKAALNNEFYASTQFDEVLKHELSPEMAKIKYLSPSERTIVRLIAQEKSSKDIAELLSISLRTVQKHRSNIIAKLDLPSVGDSLSVWATENKELFLNI